MLLEYYKYSMVGHYYPCNCSFCNYILFDLRFLGGKKISGIDLNQWINLDTKIVVEADKKQPIEFTRTFHIKPVFGSIYFKETKRDNDEIVKCKKDI